MGKPLSAVLITHNLLIECYLSTLGTLCIDTYILHAGGKYFFSSVLLTPSLPFPPFLPYSLLVCQAISEQEH